MFTNSVSLFKTAVEIYEYLCRPICAEYGIQQTGLGILLYLAKHPECNTAVDIQRCRGIKQSLVSFHVDRLVNDGLLERQSAEGDRRKVRLVCTPKASPIIEAGARVTDRYMKLLAKDIPEEQLKAFTEFMTSIRKNIDECRDKMKKGEL